MEQVDNGAADLAGAEDQDFSGHSGVLQVRRLRGVGVSPVRAARSDNSLDGKTLAGLALSLRKVKKEAADRRIDGESW